MILMNKSIFFSFTSFHRAAVVPVELNELMLLWSLCWACVSWQADYFINVYCIHWHVSVCLCSRAKELKRAREHETPQRSPLTMWHHSPDSSFLFHLYLRHFTTEIEKKNTSMQALHLLLLLQCSCFNFYMYNNFFFPHPLFPLTWCLSANGNFYGTWINSKGTGCRKGMQNICFLAFFALFFCRLFSLYEYEDMKNDEASKPRVGPSGVRTWRET